MRWVRLYTEISNDRKLRRLPPSQRWLWITMLCIARESPIPGRLLLSKNVPVNIEDMADEAAITKEDVVTGIQAFKDQDMLQEIDGVYHLTNWDKRQFSSDNSTERSRRFREKQKQEENNETEVQRCKNVSATPPDTDTDTDTDTEIKEKEMPAASTEEKEILNILRSVEKYPFDYEKDLNMVRMLVLDHPRVNMLLEIKRWRDYKMDKPLNNKSSPRLQLRNWMVKAQEFLDKGGAKGCGANTGTTQNNQKPPGKYMRIMPGGRG